MISLAMFLAFAAGAMLPTDRPAYNIVNAAAISNTPTTVGISDNDLFLTAGDPATVAKHLDEMQALGIKNIRIAIPWAAIEATGGKFDWSAIDNMVNAADARGMGILGVVNTTPAWARGQWTNLYAPPDNPATYGTFMTNLATRYAGKIGAYEVWNEPNASFAYNGPNGVDPAGYTALLKAAYTAIKAADPKASVIGGVLGSTVTFGNFALNPISFVQQMYNAGAKGYFDALSFHPYQYTLPFSTGVLGHPDSPLNQLNAIYALMQANGDGTKTIWSSEYGLPTGLVGEQAQATYLKDFLDKWSTLSYAGPTFLYTTVDRNSSDFFDPESTFGLFRDNWVAKLAATVVKNWITAHPQTPPPTTTPPTTTPNPVEQAVAAWAAALQASIAQYFANLAAALAASLSPQAPAVAAAPAARMAAVVAPEATTPEASAAAESTPSATTSEPVDPASKSAVKADVPESTSTESAGTGSSTSAPSTSAAPSGDATSSTTPSASTPSTSTPATTESTTPATESTPTTESTPAATTPSTQTPTTAAVPAAESSTASKDSSATTATKSVAPEASDSSKDDSTSSKTEKVGAVG